MDVHNLPPHNYEYTGAWLKHFQPRPQRFSRLLSLNNLPH
ncbi:hypothetical protein J830_3476, partial [Acinetobacter baumannii 25691_7]